MDYTLFKWLAPTLEYTEGGGKPSLGFQMLVVVVLYGGAKVGDHLGANSKI